ncbi:MAG: hypothetical protein AB8C13_01685 [Phycisphaerales bacterium]
MESQPRIPSVDQWISHLTHLTRDIALQIPLSSDAQTKFEYIESFADEYGGKRTTDQALLSRVLSTPYKPSARLSATVAVDVDHKLWNAVHDDSPWEYLIPDQGGLVNEGDYAIEHRTLIELCSLHALSHLVDAKNGSAFDGLSQRVHRLVDWHTRELQPDNGIHRPWGMHAFVLRSVDESCAMDMRLNTMLHAQTLLSNCCVSMGKPDLLSGIILIDSLNTLTERIADDRSVS